MFQSAKTKNIAGIDCAYSLAKNTNKTIILFHGYGADCWDLFGLKDYLDPKTEYNWYFPNGTMAAPGLPMGRAWFPIDLAELEAAMREGRFRDFSNDRPKDVDLILPKIRNMLNEVVLDPKQTIIGGFSQGAMLSLECVLSFDFKFNSLIQFSGALFDKVNLPLRAMKREGFSFFQSHGTNDVILPHHGAEALYMLLKKSGWQGSLQSFSGGHEIPLEVLDNAKTFIQSHLK